MKRQRSALASVCSALVILTVSWRMTAPVHAVSSSTGDSRGAVNSSDGTYVLLRFAAEAGRQVGSEERREALAQALIASASLAHVVICHHGAAVFGGTTLDRMCAAPSSKLKELWWDAAIAVRRAGETTVTCSLQLALGTGPTKQPAAFFLIPPIVLPRGLSAADAENAALREVSAQVAANPALGAWFERASKSPGQVHASLAEDMPASAQVDRAAEPSREPPTVSTKVAGSGTVSAGEAPDAAATPVPADATFAVRQAVIGGGFGVGTDGFLHLTDEGVAFSRKQQGSAEWMIRWRELSSATKDDGIWDVPFPIALVEKSGRVRYVAQIDGHGHYLDGGAILSAIAHGREQVAKTGGRGVGVQR